jgi:hypothetical protein
MQLTTADINKRYSDGLDWLTNITFNQFTRDMYGIQYKGSSCPRKLLMLLWALESWDNRAGAVNVLTEAQMMAIMSQIARCKADPMSGISAYQDPNIVGASASGAGGGLALSVLDTRSVDLTYTNNLLAAELRISGQFGNAALINADGLYVPNASSILKFLKSSDFTAGTNKYEDFTLAGKPLKVYHRGLGFLLYNYENANDPANEFMLLNNGGFEITIPGFDVHDGNNYFYLII